MLDEVIHFSDTDVLAVLVNYMFILLGQLYVGWVVTVEN